MTNYHTPDPQAWVSVSNLAWQLIDAAEQAGIVLEIRTQPYKPLAMGHGIMMVDMRPARMTRLQAERACGAKGMPPTLVRREFLPERPCVAHLPSDDTEGGSHD